MILDHLGNPIMREVLREEQTSSLVHLQRAMSGHPDRGLTPARLHQILEATDRGDIMAQHELFEDMEERGGHLYSELAKRKRAVIGLDYSIKPPRNPSAIEVAATEFVNEIFEDTLDLEDVLFDALDAISHGFSALELSWLRRDGSWMVDTFSHRPQSWFQLDPETRTELRLRDLQMGGVALKPFGWMVHTHKAKSGYIGKAGLGRVLIWPHLFLHYAVGDLAELLDIMGIPLRIGKYPSNATSDEKATLWRAVAGLGHSAAGIMPQSMQIEFQQAAQGSEKPFETMIRWCENTQTKAITGNMPSNDRGNGGGLGGGLADLANEIRKEIRDSDAKQLAATITQQLIYPLLALNKGWADIRRCPKFEFDIVEAEDLKLYADSLPKLVGIGMRIPSEWAHEKLRIPQGTDKDVVLTPEAKGAAPMPGKPEGKPGEPAKLTALKAQLQAVALKNEGFADQDAVDGALAEVAKGLQPQVEAWLAPALAALGKAESAEAALELLASDAPQTDDDVLIDALARAMFVCELLGVDSVGKEL